MCLHKLLVSLTVRELIALTELFEVAVFCFALAVSNCNQAFFHEKIYS